MAEYYVSLYFDNDAAFTSNAELRTLAEEYRVQGEGDPRMNFAIPQSSDPGNLAFTFDGAERASGFAREALGLDNIVGVRIGLVGKNKE